MTPLDQFLNVARWAFGIGAAMKAATIIRYAWTHGVF